MSTNTVHESIDDLLGKVATGDREAFSELYDHTAQRVLWVVRNKLIDHAQSEEVTQEVFLEVWQTASRFDPNRGRAVSWITTMAVRRAIDRVRAAQTSRKRDIQAGLRMQETPHDNVAEHVEVALEHERAARAMERITPMQREAVTMTYLHGLSNREVAEQLSVPIGTVKTRLRDGLNALRVHLLAPAA